MEKHRHQRPNHNDGCFLHEVNIPELVDEASELIKSIKPIHHLSGDKYIIDLNRHIGKMETEDMNGLCVVTVLGTKKILTMYPIILSKNFDKEDYSRILLPKK